MFIGIVHVYEFYENIHTYIYIYKIDINVYYPQTIFNY